MGDAIAAVNKIRRWVRLARRTRSRERGWWRCGEDGSLRVLATGENRYMVEVPSVHPGDNSREYVAYLLLLHLANIEGKSFEKGDKAPLRKWLLDTYAECLTAVSNPEGRMRMQAS
jgi:hypothetical protein